MVQETPTVYESFVKVTMTQHFTEKDSELGFSDEQCMCNGITYKTRVIECTMYTISQYEVGVDIKLILHNSL